MILTYRPLPQQTPGLLRRQWAAFTITLFPASSVIGGRKQFCINRAHRAAPADPIPALPVHLPVQRSPAQRRTLAVQIRRQAEIATSNIVQIRAALRVRRLPVGQIKRASTKSLSSPASKNISLLASLKSILKNTPSRPT
jgi:hypothetical protein